MMRKSMVPVVLVTMFVLSAGSVFAADQALAQTPLPIRIGYQPTLNWLLLVARDQNLFDKAGLAPTCVKFAAEAPMIAAAQSNSFDVADLGTVPFMVGMAQGVDWAMIGISTEGAYSEGIVAGKDSGIKTFADLRRKRIPQDGGIHREPRKGGHEQHHAGGAQAPMRHAVKQPEQRGAFQRPRDREPLTLELDGKDERDKKQRHAAEPCELVEPLRIVRRHRAQNDDEAGQRGEGEEGGHQAEDIAAAPANPA